MSNITFDPNDPRLTDYVLGELDDAQRAEIERLLEASPEARAAVDELLEVSGLLTESLKSQPAPALTKDQRATIEAAAVGAIPEPTKAMSRRRNVFAAFATLTVCVAALCFVVVSLNRHRVNQALTMEQSASSPGTRVALGVDNARRGSADEVVAFSADGKLVVETEQSSESARNAWQKGGSIVGMSQPGQFSGDDEQQPQTRTEQTDAFVKFGVVKGEAAESAATSSKVDSSIVNPIVTDPVVTMPLPASSVRSYTVQNGNKGGELGTQPMPKDGKTYTIGGDQDFTAQDTIAPSSASTQLKKQAVPAATPPVRGLGATPETLGRGQMFGYKGEPRQIAAESSKTVAKESLRRHEMTLTERSEKITVEEGLSVDGEKQAGLKKRFYDQDDRGESYDAIVENPFFLPTGVPLSTFSIDVDTASYANTRRFLSARQQPPRDSVRIEELINYFRYEDPAPTDGKPFAVRMEVGGCPWAVDHRLVRVALKGKVISKSQRPATNLVFLLDVSGSMRDDNKLPLVKQAMKLLVNEMTENDRIAIVTYAGEAGLKLDSTGGDKKDVILKAIDGLNADGSTNGEAGIKLAYNTAVSHLYKEGSNRVILCTDGDFNVGVSDDDELVNLIQQQARDSQVFLSIFGFGMGNLKDAKLEKLADKGNGHYGYVDNLREAKKLFVEDLTGTLYTIAKDVKLQLEFNPAKVGAYRLIGYENRVMPAKDFNDDTKDAGEIGAGHSVTALYEIVPVDKMPKTAGGAELKYQTPTGTVPAEAAKPQLKPSDELLTVSLRYKQPDGTTSEKLEFPLADKPGESAQGSRDFQWTAAVAAFGMLLRESQHRGQASFNMVLELAQGASAGDEEGHRAEFIELVKTAMGIYSPTSATPPASPQSTQPANPR